MRLRPAGAARLALALAAAVAACAVPSAPARAWGADGHRVAGAVAEAHLTPRARRWLDARLPADRAGSRPDLAEVGLWADGPARADPALAWAAPLHYVNVSRGEAGYVRERDCPDDACVVEAVRRLRARLERRGAPRDRLDRLDRLDDLDALRFLVHFAVDAHQPLHVGDPDGKGGNRTFPLWFGEVRDLHWIWDTGWLERMLRDEPGDPEDGPAWRRMALRLAAGGGPPGDAAAEVAREVELDPAVWAAESLALARAQAFDAPEALGADDLERARPAIEERLRLAGRRLAALLDALAATAAPAVGAPADGGESAGAPLRLAPAEAAAHVGRRAVVCGRVAEAVHRPDLRGAPTFLNFERPHPRATFTVVIWGDARPRFDPAPERRFRGRDVCVEGTIGEHRGRPQIVLRDPRRIRLDQK